MSSSSKSPTSARDTSGSGSALSIDTAQLRELAELLQSTDLSEIEVADGDRRIRIARTLSAAPAAQVVAAPLAATAPAAAAPAAAPAPAPAAPSANALNSPMVGTVYTCPEPGAAPFVSVGTSVKEGQTVLIIEAMKVMNPIAAPRSGKVTQIMVGNEQPVEYGEPLLVIE